MLLSFLWQWILTIRIVFIILKIYPFAFFSKTVVFELPAEDEIPRISWVSMVVEGCRTFFGPAIEPEFVIIFLRVSQKYFAVAKFVSQKVRTINLSQRDLFLRVITKHLRNKILQASTVITKHLFRFLYKMLAIDAWEDVWNFWKFVLFDSFV